MRNMSAAAVCVLLTLPTGRAQEPASQPASPPGRTEPVLERFLPTADAPPIAYRARRRLSARAGERWATMTATTTFEPSSGFSYQITDEQGSGLIRSRVLHAALDAELSARQNVQRARAAITTANYEFDPAGDAGDGLERIRIKPRRKEPLMIDGNIFLKSTDADLVRIEGLLVKRPSFWTRRVEVTREYARVAGVRVPVLMTSVADVLFVGRSTFEMQYRV